MVLQTAGKPGRVAHRAWHAEGTVGIQERLGRLVRLDPHGSQGHVDDLRQLLPKSVVREIRTPRSVGTGGGRPPPVTRWAPSNGCPYRNREIGSISTFGEE